MAPRRATSERTEICTLREGGINVFAASSLQASRRLPARRSMKIHIGDAKSTCF